MSSPDHSQISATVLGQLLDQHAPALTLYARQLCSEPEDAVQAAFVKLASRAGLPDNPAAWLFRVVRNEAFQITRASKRRKNREAIAAQTRSTWFESDPSAAIDGQAAVDALEHLPALQKEIVVARIWGKLTFKEIGKLVRQSDSTTHRTFQQAIQELRKRLEEPCKTNR